jgi:hypothetical protein
MTLQERIARYLERNFLQDQAHILILMEEAAIALFSALPEHFVLFGGATLVLFHNSPRLSKDWTCWRALRRYPQRRNSKRHCGRDWTKWRGFSASVRWVSNQNEPAKISCGYGLSDPGSKGYSPLT